MANTRYWVGKTAGTVWNSSATTGWSLTSNGASGASVPTANDYVIFDAAANSGNCIIATGAVCANFDATTYASTIGCNGANVLVVGNSTGLPGLITFGGNAKITNGTFVSKNNLVLNTANANNATFKAGNAFAGTLSMTSYTNDIGIVNCIFTVNGSTTIANAGVNTCTFTSNGFVNVITNTVFTNTAVTCNGVLTLGNSTLVNATSKNKSFSTNNNLILANSAYVNNMIINVTANASLITISNGVTFSNSTINATFSGANITIGTTVTFANTGFYWGGTTSNSSLTSQIIFVGGTLYASGNTFLSVGNSTFTGTGVFVISGNSTSWPGDLYCAGFSLINSFSISGMLQLNAPFLGGGVYCNAKNLNLGAYYDNINSAGGSQSSNVDFSGMTLTFTCNTATPVGNNIVNTSIGGFSGGIYLTNSGSLAIFTGLNGNCTINFSLIVGGHPQVNSMFNTVLFNNGTGNVSFSPALYCTSVDFTGFTGIANGTIYSGINYYDGTNYRVANTTFSNIAYITLASGMNASSLTCYVCNANLNPNAIFDSKGVTVNSIGICSGNATLANSATITSNLLISTQTLSIASYSGGATGPLVLLTNNQNIVVSGKISTHFSNIIMGSGTFTFTGKDSTLPGIKTVMTNWSNIGTIICNNQTTSSNLTIDVWTGYIFPNVVFNTGAANIAYRFILANTNGGQPTNVTIGSITWNGSGTDCVLGFGANPDSAVGNNYYNITRLFTNGTVGAPLTLTSCLGTAVELGSLGTTGNGQAIINCSSGTISLDNIIIGSNTNFGSGSGMIPNTGITATGGATFYAGPNSTNTAPAPGWIFGAVPNFGFFGHSGLVD